MTAVGPAIVPHDGTHRFVLRFSTARPQRLPLGDGYEPRRYPKTPDPMPPLPIRSDCDE